jgi:uncharacterized membrane protein YsdA (DUF1294 family)
MPPRTIQESHRPRVSNRTMRCHSTSGQQSGLFVSENCWRRHHTQMEPQAKKRRTPNKTTRRSRVHAQSVGLNAGRKIFRHRVEGKTFLLTFPYIGLLQANSCVRQLRVFCFHGSSPRTPQHGSLPQSSRSLWKQKPSLLGAPEKWGRKRRHFHVLLIC